MADDRYDRRGDAAVDAERGYEDDEGRARYVWSFFLFEFLLKVVSFSCRLRENQMCYEL